MKEIFKKYCEAKINNSYQYSHYFYVGKLFNNKFILQNIYECDLWWTAA